MTRLARIEDTIAAIGRGEIVVVVDDCAAVVLEMIAVLSKAAAPD